MKKIWGSILTLGIVAALAVAATNAFFSDTETSVGNTFVAGAIDLKIDNESYAIDYNIPGFQNPTGAFVASSQTSWSLNNLTVEKFFNFTDLKPGDYGEDTISVHVGSNDAWMCAAARVNVNSDETCTEPENADETGSCVVETNGTNGDLAQAVNFAFWKDDGDNVLEVGETPFLTGPISGLNGAGQIALADASANPVFGASTPVPGDQTVYIAKGWCFGSMAATPVVQDNANTQGPLDPELISPNGPRGTGFTCGGTGVDNKAQTDKVVGDLQFYAEQARNNGEFLCSEWTPAWPTSTPTPTLAP